MMQLKYEQYNKLQTRIEQSETQKQQTMDQVQAIALHKQAKEQEMWEEYGTYLMKQHAKHLYPDWKIK